MLNTILVSYSNTYSTGTTQTNVPAQLPLSLEQLLRRPSHPPPLSRPQIISPLSPCPILFLHNSRTQFPSDPLSRAVHSRVS